MRLLLPLLSLLPLTPTLAADFTFVHTTDTHVGARDDEGSNAAKVSAAYREISALQPKPAFAVNTGDYVEIGTPDEYATARKTLTHLTIPHYGAPGNHDVRWNPLGKEGYTLGTGQPLFQSWDHQGVHFVTLDATVLLQHWGHIDQHQLDWLKKDLEKVGPERPIIIGFHHWVGRESVQVDNEQALFDLLAPYNVRLWLMGHGHSDIQWSINGAPAIMAKGLYQGSYHVIEVTRDAIKVKRRSLGAPPRNNELVRDKAAPAADNIVWTDVLTAPLAKPPAPKWEATASVDRDLATITISTDDVPTVSAVEYRLNSGKYQPTPNSRRADVDLSKLPPGQHLLTVQLTLTDGRAYQKPLAITIDRANSPKPLWKTNVHGAVQSRLVRSGDALYVTTMSGELLSLNPSTGDINWRRKVPGPIFSTPLIADGVAYFGSADHHVYAADAKTGDILWKHKTSGAVFASPALAQGVLAIASVDRTIYGLDPRTGQPVWKTPTDGMTQSQAATDGRRFFIGSWDSAFRCLDARTGDVLWTHKLGRHAPSGRILFYFSPAISSPTTGDGLAFITSNDGVLHAFHADSGQPAWQFDGKKLAYSSPLFKDGHLFTAIGDEGKLFAFTAKTGDPLWTSTAPATIYDSSFTAANNNLFIATVKGTLCAFHATDGKPLWQYSLGPSHLLASPTADDKAVYIANQSGDVLAIPQ